jgi:hypothetical protein
MSPADLERHPPGKWSPANILEHLALSIDGTRRNLQKCLEINARRATRATLRQRLGVLWVVELGRFPTGATAPPRTQPTGLAGPMVLDAIRRYVPALDQAMAECASRFGKHGKIADHPLLGPLSLRQWRRFHLVHVRHHMRQIARLRAF